MKDVKKLEDLIKHLDTCYEKGEECINPFSNEIVGDNEYDMLRKELYSLNPNSDIFKNVTASVATSKSKKITHQPPMVSINKCNGTEKEKEDILLKWVTKFFPQYSTIPNETTELCMSYKHDGISLSCVYEKGVLTQAGLRSKSGKDGIDVTEKTKCIKNLPQKLPLEIDCIIRGEIEVLIIDFQEKNNNLDEPKSNPRSYVAGCMNRKTSELKNLGLQFKPYNIIGLGNEFYKTEIERFRWATEVLGLDFVSTMPFSKKGLELLEEMHKKMSYMIDGVVISINDLTKQNDVGHVGDKDTGNPRGKIAWKFKDEIAEVEVKDVIWQTGRTGHVTPVLIFEGVQLEGTIVSKCTAHNLGVLEHNQIGIGSKLEIIKSGKIIPKINKVIKSIGNYSVPDKCSSCNGELIRKQGKDKALSLVCQNSLCPAQNIKTLNHFLTSIGVKGISESTIEKLVNLNIVKKPGDFFRLTPKILMDNEITERTAILIVARICLIPNAEDIKDSNKLLNIINKFSKIKITIDKLFVSLGIKNAGKEVGRILASKINDWEKIKNLTVKELENIDGIGPITSKEVYQYLKENREIIEDLEQFVDIEIEQTKSGKFLNKTFVLSGSLEGGKKKWQKFIEENGGVVKSSVSSKISFLIAGEGSGSKTEKANKLGVTVLDTDELQKI